VLKILTDNFASFLRFSTKVFVFEATKHERGDIWSMWLKVQSKLLRNEATYMYLVNTAVLIIFTAPKVCPTITNFSRSDSVYYVDLQSQRKITVA